MKDYTNYITFAQDADKEHKQTNTNYRSKGQSEGYLEGRYFNAEIGAIDEEVKRLGIELNNLIKHMGGTIDEANNSQLNVLAPVGSIVTSGAIIFTGYLLCNGAQVSRTYYANLYNVIGTNYGIGDGSTTFNLPDLRENAGSGQNKNHIKYCIKY